MSVVYGVLVAFGRNNPGDDAFEGGTERGSERARASERAERTTEAQCDSIYSESGRLDGAIGMHMSIWPTLISARDMKTMGA